MRIQANAKVRKADYDKARYARPEYKTKNKTRMADYRKANPAIPEFIGVDGEGQGEGEAHRYVLLSAGSESLTNPLGIHWCQAFDFLYRVFQRHPSAAYVGFYLSYDFNQILKTFPQSKAWLLLTREGKAIRKPKNVKFTTSFPVRLEVENEWGIGWEVDMLGFKRLQIRPMICLCKLHGEKCTHKSMPWMSICDAGPFFQMPFIKVIDPKTWEDDPNGPPCSDAEFQQISVGKDRRSTAVLDKEMVGYNVLENDILGRVMLRLARGMAEIGVRLSKDQWYGPGASASRWLGNNHITKRRELDGLFPDWAFEILRGSYYGGWFEIFSHGIILGTSYNYDINSAYPYATQSLPCIHHGIWERGHGNPPIRDGAYCLVFARVSSSGNRIGALPFRRKDGCIVRPRATMGWYWTDEILASERAGLVADYEVKEWVSFTPQCDHKPFQMIGDMYEMRRKVGKNSALGLAIKLIINSVYGKFAQSIGGAPFGNWFYASRITASCRIQILDAIGSHPGRADSALMVATDGIVFDSPHPNLSISKRLGEWEKKEYHDLCLFKPGVYWHKAGKDMVYECKTRGVPRKHFLENVAVAEDVFTHWWMNSGMGEARPPWVNENGWPYLEIPVDFSMTSCLQALMRGKWELAAKVNKTINLRQDADPFKKRANPHWNRKKQRMDSELWELDDIESMPYKARQKPENEIDIYGIGMDGTIHDEAASVMEAMRGENKWDTVGGADDGDI